MQLPKPPRRHLFALVAAALLATLAACGSSGPAKSPASSSPSSSAPSQTPTPSAVDTAAAIAAIKSNWEAFFDPKTSVSRRVALLQNGQAFAPIIQAQANQGLAAIATAKVSAVQLVSPDEARVTYTILAGGKPALTNQAGIAVKQGGTWKVGDLSFCGLLLIENGGKTSALPAACRPGM